MGAFSIHMEEVGLNLSVFNLLKIEYLAGQSFVYLWLIGGTETPVARIDVIFSCLVGMGMSIKKQSLQVAATSFGLLTPTRCQSLDN